VAKAIAMSLLALALLGSNAAWARGKGVHIPTKTHHHHHHHHHQMDCYWDHFNQICVPRGT
jgi:hypothetical protein